METIEQFEIETEAPFKVRVTIDQDDPVTAGQDFDFGTDKANNDYAARFNSGELVNAIVTVTVATHGLSEATSIGGCHLRTGHIQSDARELIQDHQLIIEAFKDLKETFDKIRSLPMLPALKTN